VRLQTIILLVIALAAIALTLAGIVLPGLPGIPVLWVLVAADFWFFGYLGISGMTMFWLSLLAAITVGIDYLATALGVKKRGGSKAGAIGSAIGLVAGLTVFQIPGMLAGCFLGALAGEMLSGRDFNQAASIAVGALFGYATATVFKLGVLAVYGYVIIAHIL